MSNTFGNMLQMTVFGESHGPAIGAVLDGLPGGVKIDKEYISNMMQHRKAVGKISTARQEADEVQFLSGVKDGFSEGSPIALLINNTNIRPKDYQKTKDLARPGHADYAAHVKYHGYEDPSGGGHFSGRLTAPITACGAIARAMLETKGIYIGTHIQKLHGIEDRSFASDVKKDIQQLKDTMFPVLDAQAAEKMKAEIENARMQSDSVGGVLDTVIYGIPAGVGEPMFDSFESRLSKAVFSIGAVKGIAFGEGFGFADMYGSQANDAFMCEDGKIKTATNHNGGINGGIANGMPICFQTVIKPTPSIAKPQHTLDLSTGEEAVIEIVGRHDPAVIHRAAIVIDAMSAFVCVDLLMERYGREWFAGGDQQ